MTTSLLYFGPQWSGSTSLQRLHAFQQLEEVTAIGVDRGESLGGSSSLWRRVRWKLRWPVDGNGENRRLLEAVARHRPEIVLVDNSKVIRRDTLARLRGLGAGQLVYYTPDDIAARHNLSLPLEWSLPDWDVVCTTKTFNIAELRALGARRPVLVGKAYDPALHRPLDPAAVGPDFERFDAVFIGSYEKERCAGINVLAESGVSVVVYGSELWSRGWNPGRFRTGVELRPSLFGEDYVKAWHTGKVALCFLRKLNRDRITQRTLEIAAMGRPMVAERTDEHDQHFEHGSEYLGFRSDAELVAQVRALLGDGERRRRMGEAARRRCLASGYSTRDRARQMLAAFQST